MTVRTDDDFLFAAFEFAPESLMRIGISFSVGEIAFSASDTVGIEFQWYIIFFRRRKNDITGFGAVCVPRKFVDEHDIGVGECGKRACHKGFFDDTGIVNKMVWRKY